MRDTQYHSAERLPKPYHRQIHDNISNNMHTVEARTEAAVRKSSSSILEALQATAANATPGNINLLQCVIHAIYSTDHLHVIALSWYETPITDGHWLERATACKYALAMRPNIGLLSSALSLRGRIR